MAATIINAECEWLDDDAGVERCAVIYMIQKNNFVFCCEFCTANFHKFLDFVHHLIDQHEFENKSILEHADSSNTLECNDLEPEMEKVEEHLDSDDEASYVVDMKTFQETEKVLMESKLMVNESFDDEVDTDVLEALQAEDVEFLDEALEESEIMLEVNNIDENIQNQEEEYEQLEDVYVKDEHDGEQEEAEEELDSQTLTETNSERIEDTDNDNSIKSEGEGQPNAVVDMNFTKLDGGYLCNFCDRRFPSRTKVRQHLISHRTERKYKCSICGRAFKDSSNYNQHYRRHTQEKKIPCTECDAKFHTQGEMKRHLRRHRGEKNYMCTYCGAKFFTSGLLTAHIKRHTNTRSHTCELCDKSFYDSFTLKHHMLGHLNARNFKCEICGASFNRPYTLKAHIKLHLDQREYRCEICNAAFNQLPGLFSHMRGKHKILKTIPSLSSKRDHEEEIQEVEYSYTE